MGISVSLFLIAVGAILAFAVTATVSGVDLVTVGWILMVVGALGIVLSACAWDSWGGFGGRSYRRVSVTRDPVQGTTTSVVDHRDDFVP